MVNDGILPGDVLVDGLYQGVIFESGSLTNVYDKYPGAGDPGDTDPIDVDLDGVIDLQPVAGSPGTFTNGEKEITFN